MELPTGMWPVTITATSLSCKVPRRPPFAFKKLKTTISMPLMNEFSYLPNSESGKPSIACAMLAGGTWSTAGVLKLKVRVVSIIKAVVDVSSSELVGAVGDVELAPV